MILKISELIKLAFFKALLVLFLFFGVKLSAYSQTGKPVITYSDVKHWNSVAKDFKLSPNGRFIAYNIVDNPSGQDSLILQSIDERWRRSIAKGRIDDDCFTTASDYFIYKIGSDSIAIFGLKKKVLKYLSGLSSIQLLKAKKQSFIIYRDKREKQQLRLFQIGQERAVTKFTDVQQYFYDKPNSQLVLVQQKKMGDKDDRQILIKNLISGDTLSYHLINQDILSMSFSKSGNIVQLSENKKGEKAISYFDKVSKSLKWLIDDKASIVGFGREISDVSFAAEGHLIFSTIDNKKYKYAKINGKKPLPTPITINSYLDSNIKSTRAYRESLDKREYGFNLTNSTILILNDGIHLTQSSSNKAIWVVLENNSVVKITSIKYGKTIKIKDVLPPKLPYFFSPSQDYLLFFDQNKNTWMSYDIANERCSEVTKNKGIKWLPENRIDDASTSVFSPSGWLDDGKSALLQDGHSDIWMVDLEGKISEKLISNSVGKVQNVKLDIIGCGDPFAIPNNQNDILSSKQVYYFSGFNNKTKAISYYQLEFARMPKFNEISILPNIYDDHIVKADDSNAFLLLRMRVDQSPNLFSTKDFKKFIQLTSLFPEKKLNWITSELITARSNDTLTRAIESGERMAILYKPENFDSKKKYPVIFYYYERLSDGLNQFIRPGLTGANINIPWFVSRGYLVCAVDMHYRIGYTGQSALNSLNTIADELVKKSYVDSSKLGLQGHSFGGFETNYFITHSSRFKAAVSAAGVSNLISMYGALRPDTKDPQQENVEYGQLRMGKGLWHNNDRYIENSAVFHVEKVTTPVLLVGNELDNAVPIQQVREFFLSLKRFGKPVWWLQYENEKHIVRSEKFRLDLTTRTEQFFDYYLKDMPVPRWMVETIPAEKQNEIDEYLMYSVNK